MSKKLNGIKIHDSAFKFMVDLDPQGLLDRFGIPHKFKEFLPTENVLKISSRYSMDCLILTQDDIILNIEFQSTYPSKAKQEAFREYATLTAEKYDKQVITYIITIPPVIIEEHWNKLRCNLYHKVFEKSCKNLDGMEILNNITNKLENNEILTNKDKQDLILAPYSTDNIDKSARLLKKSMELVHQIKTNDDDELNKEKGNIKYLLIRLCERIIKNGRCEEIRRLGKMGNPIFDEWKQEGLDEGEKNGMKKGMKKGVEQVAKKLKDMETDMETIKNATGLTAEQINKL